MLLCIFSDEESARCSSVAVSAEVIRATSLPLQFKNHSVSNESNISADKMTKKHRHGHRRPVECNTVRLSVASGLCDECCGVKDKGSKSQHRRRKHKRREGESDVSESVSNELCESADSVTDNCCKVDEHLHVGKCQKRKHKNNDSSQGLRS